MNFKMLSQQQFRSRGADNTNHHDRPFRFLALPIEIRTLVYQALFQDYHLHIDIPQRLNSTLGERAALSAGASVPGILLVSKALRNEALPYFSKHLVAVFHNQHGTRQVPNVYLHRTKTAIVHSINTKYINDVTMPKLELILVEEFFRNASRLNGNLAYGIKEDDPDTKVINDCIRIFKSGIFYSQLLAIQGNRRWPFEVYLKQSVSVKEVSGHFHHTQRFALWKAPVISYVGRAIVGGPPRPTFVDKPVEPVARKLQFN